MPQAVNAESLHLSRKTRTPMFDLEAIVSGVFYILTAVLVITPIVYLIYGSFLTDSPNAPGATWTLANWARAYTDPTYLSAFFNTLTLSTTVAILAMIMGAAMAWIVSRTNAPGRNKLAMLVIVPLMLSNLITAVGWIALAAPNAGFINAATNALFGIRTIFDIYSFQGIVLVLAVDQAAFAFVAFYAALRSIDGALEEASYTLGAGPVQTGLRMTLPLIFPTVAATFLLIFVSTAENFSVPTLLGSSFGYQTLPSRIYFDMTVEPSKPTMAAATGMMLLWIALAGTLWQRRILARASQYVTISGKGSRPRITDLGLWKYVATGCLVVYLLLGVILPYSALLFSSFLNFLTPRLSWKLFTLDNYLFLLRRENVDAIINSLMFSIGGGLLITGLYVTLSYFIKRSSTGSSRLIEYVAMIPTAIPAVVLAVGILWTFVGMPLPIYGTAVILIIAYFTRYIGLGVRQSRTALAQVSGELTEAARMSGASPLRAFTDVTVPLVRPAALALWTLLFMSIFTEISVTILLYSYDTVTLPVRLWNDMSQGHQTRAIAVAVLQASIMFVIIFAADRKFGILRNTLER